MSAEELDNLDNMLAAIDSSLEGKQEGSSIGGSVVSGLDDLSGILEDGNIDEEDLDIDGILDDIADDDLQGVGEVDVGVGNGKNAETDSPVDEGQLQNNAEVKDAEISQQDLGSNTISAEGRQDDIHDDHDIKGEETIDSMEYDDNIDEIDGDEIDEIVGDEVDEIVDDDVDEILEHYDEEEEEKGDRPDGEDDTADLQLESTIRNQEQFTVSSSRKERDVEEEEGEDPWLDSESVADTVTSADSMSAAMHQQLMRKKLRIKLSGKDSVASSDSRFERTPSHLRSAYRRQKSIARIKKERSIKETFKPKTTVYNFRSKRNDFMTEMEIDQRRRKVRNEKLLRERDREMENLFQPKICKTSAKYAIKARVGKDVVHDRLYNAAQGKRDALIRLSRERNSRRDLLGVAPLVPATISPKVKRIANKLHHEEVQLRNLKRELRDQKLRSDDEFARTAIKMRNQSMKYLIRKISRDLRYAAEEVCHEFDRSWDTQKAPNMSFDYEQVAHILAKLGFLATWRGEMSVDQENCARRVIEFIDHNQRGDIFLKDLRKFIAQFVVHYSLMRKLEKSGQLSNKKSKLMNELAPIKKELRFLMANYMSNARLTRWAKAQEKRNKRIGKKDLPKPTSRKAPMKTIMQHVDQLHKKRMGVELRISALAKDVQAKQLAQCTFQPKICKKAGSPDVRKVHDRLHKDHKERQGRYDAQVDRHVSSREEQFEKQCTFSPEIRKVPESSQQGAVKYDSHMEKTIERMRKVNIEGGKLPTKKYFSITPKNHKTYSGLPIVPKDTKRVHGTTPGGGISRKKTSNGIARKDKSRKISSPKKATVSKNSPLNEGIRSSNEEVLLYLDVQLAPDMSDRICIHKGDSIEAIAKDFATKHNLAPEYLALLQKTLIDQLNALVVAKQQHNGNHALLEDTPLGSAVVTALTHDLNDMLRVDKISQLSAIVSQCFNQRPPTSCSACFTPADPCQPPPDPEFTCIAVLLRLCCTHPAGLLNPAHQKQRSKKSKARDLKPDEDFGNCCEKLAVHETQCFEATMDMQCQLCNVATTQGIHPEQELPDGCVHTKISVRIIRGIIGAPNKTLVLVESGASKNEEHAGRRSRAQSCSDARERFVSHSVQVSTMMDQVVDILNNFCIAKRADRGGGEQDGSP
eukprot:jgi/Bigna1/68306/fgenesh1_pg.5_\